MALSALDRLILNAYSRFLYSENKNRVFSKLFLYQNGKILVNKHDCLKQPTSNGYNKPYPKLYIISTVLLKSETFLFIWNQ